MGNETRGRKPPDLFMFGAPQAGRSCFMQAKPCYIIESCLGKLRQYWNVDTQERGSWRERERQVLTARWKIYEGPNNGGRDGADRQRDRSRLFFLQIICTSAARERGRGLKMAVSLRGTLEVAYYMVQVIRYFAI